MFQPFTDVSGQPIGPIFNGFSDCLPLDEGADRLYRNVGNLLPYPSTLPDTPEDRRPQVLVWLLTPLLRSPEYEHLLKPVTTSCKI
jgi:hypothetical protein